MEKSPFEKTFGVPGGLKEWQASQLPKCDEPTCPGHLGKFSDCVAEAVYEWSLDGSNDGETGEVDFQGHYSLYILSQAGVVSIDPDGDHRIVVVPAGNYILHSADSGAVSLWKYETEAEARQEFEAADEAYGAWLDLDGSEED